MTKRAPFRYLKTSPKIIHLAVMQYVRFPLSLCNLQALMYERGIEISHDTVRFWSNRFGPMSAEVRCRPLFSLQSLKPGTPLLLTRQFQVQPNRRSYWVTPIIERIDSGCASNPFRFLIRLTAATGTICKLFKVLV